jgi:hypothetical protein
MIRAADVVPVGGGFGERRRGAFDLVEPNYIGTAAFSTSAQDSPGRALQSLLVVG